MQSSTFHNMPSTIAPLHPANITAPIDNSLKKQVCARVEAKYCISVQTSAEPALEEVRVGMAEMKVENKPVELVTSVGSCVAICMYDHVSKCGGLTHVMLPDSAISPNNLLPSKFADTAVPALSYAITKIGGNKAHLSAKIAGGANMFPTIIKDGTTIGEKNIDAVKAALAANKIKLCAEEVGGSHGRKVTFNAVTGVMIVRHFNGEIKRL